MIAATHVEPAQSKLYFIEAMVEEVKTFDKYDHTMSLSTQISWEQIQFLVPKFRLMMTVLVLVQSPF